MKTKIKVTEITRIVSDNCHGNIQMTAQLKLKDDPVEVGIELEKMIHDCLVNRNFVKELNFNIDNLKNEKKCLEDEIKLLRKKKAYFYSWSKKHKIPLSVFQDDELPF